MTRIELIQILKETGQTELNATKLGSAIYEAFQDYSPTHLATKEDIGNVRAEIANTKADLIDKINSITMKLGVGLGTGFVVSTAILGLLITFHK